jgi:tetratricopeptide (TPR) repeat protein
LRWLYQQPTQLALPLAYALKDVCYNHWATDPLRAIGAAKALDFLATLRGEPEIRALAAWANGIAAVATGEMEQALQYIDEAHYALRTLGKGESAIATQVVKLIALAMLGRYNEALVCGVQARDSFLAAGDLVSAGKVEQNLGTMAWRRDRYEEAAQFHQAARQRFAAAGNLELLVAAENGLANALASQYRIREAAEIYEQALARAQAAQLEVRQAEIECNLGNLALAQGNYDDALDYLERSRRRYAALGMAHESAYAEQELAEAYLALNMAKEASAIYARVTPTFAALGMRFEQGWALAHHGQALIMLERYSAASECVEAARSLLKAEGSAVSLALANFFKAQLAYQAGDYITTLGLALITEMAFAEGGSHGRALLARLLRGEVLGKLERVAEARLLLEDTLHEAEQRRLPQIVQRCYTALGLLAMAIGDHALAEKQLVQAAKIIEHLRAPLPSDEIRTAFIADKLGPYSALMRLCLESSPPRLAEAFHYSEQARARALAEIVGQSVQTLLQPRDRFDSTGCIASCITVLPKMCTILLRPPRYAV